MAKEPKIDQRYLDHLYEAIRDSRQILKPFREKRLHALKQFVGAHYGDSVGIDKNPTNFMEMAVMIYVRALAANQPKAMITTPHASLRPFAKKLELGIDHLMGQKIDVQKELQSVVTEALFSIGIMKIGLNESETVTMGNFKHGIGQPFAESVSLDDWVWDMDAKKIEQCAFMGHRVRIPLDDVKDSGLYDKKRVDKLTEPMFTRTNPEGDERGNVLSRGDSWASDNKLEKYVELWEIWIPRLGLIVTLDLETEGEPLRVVEWDGPTNGPYRFLSYQDVLDNLMPLPPVALWVDLHELGNRIFRKLGRQAERQKTILGVQTGNDEDAQRITAASDGEAIRLDNPDKSRELSFGGANQLNFGIFLQIKDLFNMFGGNLEVLGGLSPQADTLGQEELIAASASKRLAAMQDKTIATAKGVMRDLAWWLWTDPYIELPVVYRVPGTNREVHTTFSARDRTGDFLDYNFDIVPYSMQAKSPSQQAQSFLQIWQNIILPALPMMHQQGISLNMEEVIRFLADKIGLDEIDRLVQFTGQSMEQDMGPVTTQGAQKPAHTTRTYERVNRPGRTRRASDYALSQSLFGGDSQPLEKENASRGGGYY